MEDIYLQAAAIVVAVISVLIAIFQFMLFLGLPLADYSWGGKYQGVLPKRMRYLSLPSALLLLSFGFIFLIHTRIFSFEFDLPTNFFVWTITIFMGLNTLGNLASKSTKERIVMTPLACTMFISCLFVLIFSK
ncbi:hypothetical protein [Metabacillus litoralis]|uniref:hypothetical protein n=1 Tax=Metabacillus litoralis TaxID=152268 RepID=UPI001CFDFE24|nr:hypothetical protein [Metabacillus litoralis]